MGPGEHAMHPVLGSGRRRRGAPPGGGRDAGRNRGLPAGEGIATFKLPERLEIRDELPRNPLGKILKRELRDELRQ